MCLVWAIFVVEMRQRFIVTCSSKLLAGKLVLAEEVVDMLVIKVLREVDLPEPAGPKK
jgi:hypothetical protein